METTTNHGAPIALETTPVPAVAAPASGSEAERDGWIGWNNPDTRRTMDRLGEMVAACTPEKIEVNTLTLFLVLARYHALEDMGYRRDWEGIAGYCPRTDDEDDTPQNIEGDSQRPAKNL